MRPSGKDGKQKEEARNNSVEVGDINPQPPPKTSLPAKPGHWLRVHVMAQPQYTFMNIVCSDKLAAIVCVQL